MAALDNAPKRKLESVLEMGGGYVLVDREAKAVELVLQQAELLVGASND